MSIAGLGTMLGAGMDSFRATKDWKDDRADAKYERKKKKTKDTVIGEAIPDIQLAAGNPSQSRAVGGTQATVGAGTASRAATDEYLNK